MKIQYIKAKYLRAGYKTLNEDGIAVGIKLIKKIPNKPDLYSIIFETGTEVILTEDETLSISFGPRK